MGKILTIGIAVYNIKEEYLRACIKSVLKNRCGKIEIIIVDDCSTDESGRICREYAEKYDDIRYIKMDKNMGIGAVRNKMIKEAKGKYIMFADGDDLVSDKLKNALECMEKDLFDVLIFDYVTFAKGEVKKVFYKNLPCSVMLDEKTVRNLSASAAVRHCLYSGGNISVNLHPNTVCVSSYKVSFLRENNLLFNETLKSAEDSLFNANVYFANPKCAYYPVETYFYRMNPHSVTKKYSPDTKKVTDAYLFLLKQFIEENFAGDKNVFDSFLIYRIGGAICDNCERNIFHKDNPNGKNIRKKIFLKLANDKFYLKDVKKSDIQRCENHKLRLILKLTKSKNFFALDFAYSHKWVFSLYGGVMSRIKRLKRGK